MTDQSMTQRPEAAFQSRRLELTIAGRFTALIGLVCLAALLLQNLLGGWTLPPGRAVLAGLVVLGLLLLDRQILRRYGERPPLRVALALLLTHALLVELLTLLDGLTYTAIMYLTLPFPAFFLLGVRAGAAVSGGLLGWFTLKFILLKPGGLTDPTTASTYLLFLVALALIAVVALVVQRERAERQRAEGLLHDLAESHRQLGRSHTQLLRYAEQVAELATIEERNRVARDIHDSLGHALTVIGVQLEKALMIADDDPAATRAAVGHAKRMADQALGDVRRSVGALRRDQAPFGLRPALERLVADLAGLPFQISLVLEGDEHLFSQQQLLALYRAAQEGLTNVQKHARAHHVRIALELGTAAATLTLLDDGVGLNGDPFAAGGFGLRGVRERLELVSGRLSLDSTPGGGTCLRAIVPRLDVAA